MESSNDSNSIPFIAFTENEGFKITQESKDFLNSLNTQKLGIISIVGKYRTGKSYFINKVLLNSEKKKGFAVGPTINPCTKGIWLWKKLMRAQDFGAEEDMDVLVLDTEGFGGIDENVNHDTRIFLFSILLSSYFIYNSVGSIDEGAIQSLSLIVNLAKDIKIKNKGENTDEDIKENFPTFLWVIRDFILSLEDKKGDKLTSKKYLENALAHQNGISESVESKNKIRKMLKYFFQERDCITMVRPVETERDLQRLDVLDIKYLRPEFIEQLSVIRQKIYKKVRPKYIGGKIITPSILVDAAEAYVKSINMGNVPNIENAWTYICEEETQKSYYDCVKNLGLKIKEFEDKGIFFSDNENFKTLITNNIVKDFKTNIIGEVKNISSMIEKLENEIHKKIDLIIKEKKYEIEKVLEKNFEEKYFLIKQKLMHNEIKDYNEARKLLNEIKKDLSNDDNKFKNSIIKDLIEKKEKEILSFLLEQKYKEEEKKRLEELDNNNRLIEMNSNLEELTKQLNKKDEIMLESKEKIKELKEEIGENKLIIKELKNLNGDLEKKLKDKETEQKEWNEKNIYNFEQEKKNMSEQFRKENLEMEKNNNIIERDLMLMKQKVDLLQNELKRKDLQELELNKEMSEVKNNLNNLKKLSMESSTIDSDTVLHLKNSVVQYEKEVLELKMKNQYLKDQIDFFKSQNVEIKNIYEKFFSNFQPKRNEHESNHSDLLSTNKILCNSLEKSQNKIKSLEEQVKYFKQFKKIIKYANSVQCFKCFRDINPNVFIEHLNDCTVDNSHNKKEIEKKKIIINQISKKKTRVKINSNLDIQQEDFKNAIKSSIIETEDIFVKINNTSVNNVNKHPFIQYVIVVYLKNQENWVVKRRYTEFCTLYNDIIEEFPDILLPKSSVLLQACNYQMNSGGKQEPLLEERKKSLENFINDLLKIKRIRYSGLFRDFLELDEPIQELFSQKNEDFQGNFQSRKSDFFNKKPQDFDIDNNQNKLDYKDVFQDDDDDYYDEEFNKYSRYNQSYNSSSKKQYLSKFNKHK